MEESNHNHACAVVCVARNEGRYLPEWLWHYKRLGFKNAIIYDNDDTPSVRREIESYPYLRDFVRISETFVGYHYRDFQKRIYTNAYRDLSDRYDYLAFFDVDEFLMIDGTISKFLSNEQFDGFSEIRVPWRTFGDCGIVMDDGSSCMARFKTPLVPDDKITKFIVKSIIKTGIPNLRITAHGAGGIPACTASGESVESEHSSITQRCDYGKAALNHYRTKTIDEWMSHKVGRSDHLLDDLNKKWMDKVDDFFKINERTPEKMAVVEKYLKGAR